MLDFDGSCFDQPIHVTPLPKELKVLKLGDEFDQSLDNVVWPEGLKEVAIGRGFTGKESPRLGEVVWPKGLLELTAPMMIEEMGHLPSGCTLRFSSLLPGLDNDSDDYEMDPWSMGFDYMMWEHFMNSSDSD